MNRRLFATIGGASVLLVSWALVAATQLTVVVPSPAETAKRLLELAEGPLFVELGRTALRSAQGVGGAAVVGVFLGLGAGSSAVADAFVRPIRATLTGLPSIVTVVLVSIWVGIDGDAVPLAVGLSILPVVWITTSEAVQAVDSELTEMAAGLHLKRRWVLVHLVLPAVAPQIRAVVAYAGATALRLTMMAELLSASDGVGARIARARSTLDTPEVFAWALVAILSALALEVVLLGGGRRNGRTSQS